MSVTCSTLLGVKNQDGFPEAVHTDCNDLERYQNFSVYRSSSSVNCANDGPDVATQSATAQLQLTSGASNQAFNSLHSITWPTVKNSRSSPYHKHVTWHRRARHMSSIHQGSIFKVNHQHQPKFKAVDDNRIRAAFALSYAFVDPSSALLSTMQPSSFRLDGFNDLPIHGGDRPDLHEALRNCGTVAPRPWKKVLNGKILPELSEDNTETRLDKVRFAWFASAMSAPDLCYSILAAQAAVQERKNPAPPVRDRTRPGVTETSPPHVRRKCIEYIRRHRPVEASLTELG